MNSLRWFSIHEPAKLSCSVNVVKMSSRRARYSAAPSTIRGDDSHLRLFQTGSIGLRCGEPTGRKTRSIPSSWARCRVCAQMCEEKLSKTSRIRSPGFCSRISSKHAQIALLNSDFIGRYHRFRRVKPRNSILSNGNRYPRLYRKVSALG